MENKKRPNDDTLEPEAMSSNLVAAIIPPSNDNSHNASSQMDVDNASTDKSISLPVTDNASSLGEANKRLKLTVETSETENGYPTSVEIKDPSRESIDLATSTETKGNEKANLDSEVTGGSSSEPNPLSIAKDDKNNSNADVGATDHSTVHEEITSTLASSSSVETQSTKPNIADDEDTIMAAALAPSLSEPHVTTLGIPTNDQGSDISIPLTESVKPPQPDRDMTSDLNTLSENNPEISTDDASPLKIPAISKKSESISNQSDQSQIQKESEILQPIVDTKEPDTSKLDPTTSADVEMTIVENMDGIKSMVSPKLAPSELPNRPASESSKPELSDTQNIQTPKPAPSQQINPHGDVKQISSGDSIPKSTPTLQAAQPIDISPNSQSTIANTDSEVKKQSPTNQLPPLASQVSTTPLPTLQQNIRPRSTMSVSALLVGNDDDESDRDEANISRQASRNIFDQFDASQSDPLHPSHVSTPQMPPHQTSQQIQSQLHTQPSGIPPISQSQPTSIQSTNASSSPRTNVGAPNIHRTSDSSDIASVSRQSSPVINRSAPETTQVSRRAQDTPTMSNTNSRGSSQKDYSADEVVESGGVSGYGNQRHLLASPVGIRPSHESINGSNQHTSKLPGVGSVAGIPTHSQDYSTHHGSSYRGDNTQGPISSRQNSYSPNQLPPMSQSTGANGHPYSNPVQSGNTSNIPSNNPSAPLLSETSPTTSIHHPKLVIKNDPSLMLDAPSKAFLGYFLYNPSLLLPSMQGKENSRLEVRVASSYLTYDNAKVKKRELWGTDIYTDDSDIVAMLIHSGLFIPPTSLHGNEEDTVRPSSQQHNFVEEPIKHICPGHDLAVTLRVVPKLAKYQGSIKNRIKSRTWSSGHDGVSLKIESVRKLGPGEALNRGRSQSKRRMKEYSQERLRVLSKIHDETTESLQNERAMRTATFEFTHQGDPW
ncbi:hypothetical protein BGZ76_002797 [Entomortierella beljakovae]|nr:hypothetical protein BGZ76_002797 [Entomortierella beljakovae]